MKKNRKPQFYRGKSHTMTDRSIAVIGAGAWGKNHIRVFSQLEVLSLICEADDSLLNELQQKYQDIKITSQLKEVIENAKIHAVVIASPAETHYGIAKECLMGGKDVLVEKPLALKPEEAEELIELAKRQQRILMVGHLLHYHPALVKLKQLIKQGELGKINYIYSNRLNYGKVRTEENILWSFAPHDISAIMMLLDEQPISVAASGASYLYKYIVDVTLSTLDFKSGVHAHIFVSWLHPFKEQKLVVVGDKKMAVFDDTLSAGKLKLYPHQINWVNRVPVLQRPEGETVEIEEKEPLREECIHFLHCIETRERPRTDGEEGLRVLKILDACQRSLDQSGQKIHIGSENLQVPIKSGQAKYFVHPTSTIDEPCEIGEGTKIWHYSHIMQNSKIGKNCNIGQNVVVSPNVVLGNNVKIQNNVSVYTGVICEDDVFLGPSMVFTNVFNPRSAIVRRDKYEKTLVKKGATIGANATIICGHTIGRYSFVGAGAVVTKDIPDYALVVGNPARQVGWACECGERIHFSNLRQVAANPEGIHHIEKGIEWEQMRDKKSPQESSGKAKCKFCGKEYLLNKGSVIKE